MNVRLLLTDPIPPAFAERLRSMLPAGVSLDVVSDDSEAEFARRAPDADVLVVAHRHIGAHELALAPNLKLVHKLGAGYDNLDTTALRERGVAAAYTPGVNAGPVAEHTIMLMLAVV
ncbi:MAG: 3-phosphoglycerate dehydrogenase, partial [Chloroflexi bacterium]|nr:3-phosphoglycerate dehydrogenase [Chloroflexota bacterium]